MIEPCMPTGPRIALDAKLLVLRMNLAAQRLLASNTHVLILQHQRLHAPAHPQALNRCLSLVAAGGRAAVALARPGLQPLTLLAERRLAASGPGILITLRDPELETPDPALLQSLFGLTPTEALVAAALAQGQDSIEIARSMGVQPNTVQSHVKRVLLKSGARRQSQLVSLILRSAAMQPPVEGRARAEVPGLAQMDHHHGTHAGHAHAQPEPVPCGCRPLSLSSS